jgi:hypothetical protein
MVGPGALALDGTRGVEHFVVAPSLADDLHADG